MSYEALFREFEGLPEFQAYIPLKSQKAYGITASILSIMLILFAFNLSNKKQHGFIVNLTMFSFLSLIGSLLMGVAIVFITNSFGVYV